MPVPTTPTLSLSYRSPTSFTATVRSDPSPVLNRFFYTPLSTAPAASVVPVTGPTLAGPGTVTVANLPARGAYQVWVVSDGGGSSGPHGYSLPAYAYVTLIKGDSLAQALCRYWSEIPVLLTTCGPLFTDQVPATLDDKDVHLPYSTLEVSRTHLTFTFESPFYEWTKVCFTVYTPGLETAETVAANVRAYFDWQQFNVIFATDAATAVALQPTDYDVRSELVTYRTGETIYRVETSYEVIVQRIQPFRSP